MGCWQYFVNMGAWQDGQPDPSNRFLGTVSVVTKYAGAVSNVTKYAGTVSNAPKFAGTAAVNT